jgi:hypothetical protein
LGRTCTVERSEHENIYVLLALDLGKQGKCNGDKIPAGAGSKAPFATKHHAVHFEPFKSLL